MTPYFCIRVCLLVTVWIVVHTNCLKDEQSYLNDLEKIKEKIDLAFISKHTGDGVDLPSDEIEKVSDKPSGTPEVPPSGPQVKGGDKISTYHGALYSRIPDKFDLPIVKSSEEEIEEDLNEIKKKIQAARNQIIGLNEDEIVQRNYVLHHPSKFEDSKSNIYDSDPSINKEVEEWLKAIDSQTGVDKQGVLTPSERGRVILEDPTLTKRLARERMNKPNWTGSATTLVKGVTFRDELLDQIDEEGRSVASYMEQASDASGDKSLDGDLNEIFEKEPEPEELSLDEHKDKLKHIVTNDIPKGELLSENEFKYEGELFSGNYFDKNINYLDRDPVQYIDVEDFIENEVKTTENKNKNKAKRKKRKQKKKKKIEFSPPVTGPTKLGEELQELENKDTIEKKAVEFRKKKGSFGRKTSNVHPYEFGYEELNFDATESFTSSQPVIVPPEKVERIERKASIRAQDRSKGSNNKKSLPIKLGNEDKQTTEGYDELRSLSILEAKQQLTSEGETTPKIIQQIPGNLPKRTLPKMPQLREYKGSILSPATKMSPTHKEPEPSTVSTEESISQIFEEKEPSAIEHSNHHKVLISLIEESKKLKEESDVKILVPENKKMPKRKRQ